MPLSAPPSIPTPASGLLAEGISFARRGRPILREVGLQLHAGEIVALRGPNGAGKTTLVRLLTGSLEPDGGRVLMGALELSANRRDFLGRVGHAAAGDRGLYARLDVRTNIGFAVAMRLATHSRAKGAELVAAAIDRFGLGGLARQRVDRLSTGQRQRVRLAICFAHEPHVVMLDEPTASLDAEGVGVLAAELASFAARGGGALWVAPSGETPALPADRWCELVDGAVEPA